MKKFIDLFGGLLILAVSLPFMLIFMALIFFGDFKNPFYFARRVGYRGREFTMIKLRTMVANADKSGVDSTASDDQRITKVGALVRKLKIDEFAQFINVVKGDMSIVGPRPNVKRETDLYTAEEKRLLSCRPGITDIASIVFSDEGEILAGQADPDIAYNQLIRPGKGMLGLFYIDNRSLRMDLKLIYLTALAILDRKRAIQGVVDLLKIQGATENLLRLASREFPLQPSPPPGATKVVTDRLSVPE